MEKTQDKPFDFWNDHSLEFLEMAMKRDFQERVSSCSGQGEKSRSCGDTITFYLMIKGGIIQSISYDVKGCLYSHACANTLIHLVKRGPVETAGTISPDDICGFLKTLPEAEKHCAELAVDAFQNALLDYRQKKIKDDQAPASL